MVLSRTDRSKHFASASLGDCVLVFVTVWWFMYGQSGTLQEYPAPAAGWNRVTRVYAAGGQCVGLFTQELHAYTTVLTRLESGVHVRVDF